MVSEVALGVVAARWEHPCLLGWGLGQYHPPPPPPLLPRRDFVGGAQGSPVMSGENHQVVASAPNATCQTCCQTDLLLFELFQAVH